MQNIACTMPACKKQHLATFEVIFIKKLSNTEAELKKNVAHKKSVQLKINPF